MGVEVPRGVSRAAEIGILTLDVVIGMKHSEGIYVVERPRLKTELVCLSWTVRVMPRSNECE